MQVNIYKLENPDEPVITLSGGYHVLGRGSMLRCFDKRVSRTHAKLYIGGNSVSLTSTHVNPCFHRSVDGKTVTIIVKDETRQLNQGDRFALLADQFWYRMEIQEVKEEKENKSPQLTQNVAGVSGTNQRVSSGNETICVTNQSDQVGNKDGKEECEDEAKKGDEKSMVSPSIEKNGERQVNVADEPKILEKMEEGIIQADDIEYGAGPSDISNLADDSSQSLLHNNTIVSCCKPADDSQPIEVSSDENGMSQKRNISSDDNSVSPKKRRKVSSNEDDPKTPEDQMNVSVDRCDDQKDILKDESVEEELQLELCLVESSEDIKNVAEQCDQVEEKIGDETNKPPKDENEGEEESSEYAQKEEATNKCTSDDMETDHGDEHNETSREKEADKENATDSKQVGTEDGKTMEAHNEGGNDNEQAGAKDSNKIEANKEDSDINKQPGAEDNAGASTSGVPGPTRATVRRERCWYATSCYRKDPNHKVDFSHPGDDDYDDDAKDDRPMCAYGISCYRRNLNHRRQYRHLGPPAPRPDRNNDGRRPRRAATRRVNYNENNTPDDYDYNDPFIDDGSSDEYNASDDSDSGRETDFNPSQDSEDINDLVADAKKFMKK